MSRRIRTDKSVYWDSCVFIRWMDPGDRLLTSDEALGLQEETELIDKGAIQLVTSSLTRIEIPPSKHLQISLEKYDQLMSQENVIEVPIDVSAAEIARRIRSDRLRCGKKLKTPDAIHLATAIHYKVDELRTLDADLSTLSGKIGEWEIIVRNPTVFQPNLLTGINLLEIPGAKSGLD